MNQTGQERGGILFVHEAATRNGAAMALLHILRWFTANGGRPFSVALSCGGSLLDDFRDVAPTWVDEECHWFPAGIRSQAATALGIGTLAHRMERLSLRRFVARCQPALIYMNAFAASNFRLIELLNVRVPILTHVHDLAMLFQIQAGPNTPRILAATRHFIACSQAVNEYLVHEHKVRRDKIDIVHESIPVRHIRNERTRDEVLRQLNLPPDAALVVGGGAASWRKGADLFVQLARMVCQRRPNAYFAWVGGGMIHELEHDAGLAKLTPRMRFTGEVTNPLDYFAAADVFVLTSREDPFPLVCLEAAAVAKPIVCFADAGGMPEFVEDNCGFIVPYLDLEAMAERVVRLLDCPACRAKMGTAARQKVIERHDVDRAAPRIAEIIERTIAGD